MSDAQFGILVSVLGSGMAGLIAVIRFSFSRIVKALDDNSKAMTENTKSNAVLSTKIDDISAYVRTQTHKLPRAKTAPGG